MNKMNAAKEQNKKITEPHNTAVEEPYGEPCIRKKGLVD